MRKLPRLARTIVIFIPAIFVAFATGLLLNAYYQTKIYYDALLPKGRLAVFISKSAQDSHQIIAEKMLNIEGVAGAIYVPQDKVLDTALQDAPGLREVLVTGDNPFSPYFIVEPREMTLTAARWLKDQITAVEGVEEVRYDGNTFNIVGNLGIVVQVYGIALKVLGIAAVLYVILRFLLNWMYRIIDYRHYLVLLLGGVAAGTIGAGAYYAVGQYGVRAAVVQMPDYYIAYMVAVGIVAALMGEH